MLLCQTSQKLQQFDYSECQYVICPFLFHFKPQCIISAWLITTIPLLPSNWLQLFLLLANVCSQLASKQGKTAPWEPLLMGLHTTFKDSSVERLCGASVPAPPGHHLTFSGIRDLSSCPAHRWEEASAQQGMREAQANKHASSWAPVGCDYGFNPHVPLPVPCTLFL